MTLKERIREHARLYCLYVVNGVGDRNVDIGKPQGLYDITYWIDRDLADEIAVLANESGINL